MTLQTFMASLRSQNVQVWFDRDRLRCSGPKEVLTAEVRAEPKKPHREISSW
jgi:hypothetical protein